MAGAQSVLPGKGRDPVSARIRSLWDAVAFHHLPSSFSSLLISSLESSDTKVYEPERSACFRTACVLPPYVSTCVPPPSVVESFRDAVAQKAFETLLLSDKVLFRENSAHTRESRPVFGLGSSHPSGKRV